MEHIVNLAEEIWNELVEASHIKQPMQAEPFYNDVVKKEDPNNSKVFLDFKKRSEMTTDDDNSATAKSSW